jgi:transcriptional regulator
MHIQSLFREERLDHLHRFINTHSLATLVVGAPQLQAHPMPLEIVGDGLGTIRGHVARSHPLWRTTPRGTEVLSVFQGPNAYISPRWYVNGQRTGRVAPSWNYTTVHASGRIRFIDDETWVSEHLASLTSFQESRRAHPWQVTDARADFVADMVRQLVGLEIAVERIEGKNFLSQQRTPADRESLARHLRAEPLGSAADVAAQIERLNRGPSDAT